MRLSMLDKMFVADMQQHKIAYSCKAAHDMVRGSMKYVARIRY